MLRLRRAVYSSFTRRYCSSLKSVSPVLEDKYDAERVELGWEEEWSSKRSKEQEKPDQTTFRMVLPPPNITGDLHLGHALTVALEDSICSFRRLRGMPVIWIPGTDHAGIATQTVLERRMTNQRIEGAALSRAERLDMAREWREEKETKINSQLRRLGASLNWERALFTMDERMSAATSEAFVRIHEAGKIYRAQRLVNWCYKLRSTISDIEVEHIEVQPDQVIDGFKVGCLHSFAYPVVGGGEVLVSTGRIDTMLADVAVAVHPDDKRYSHLKHLETLLEHPITKRKLKLVKDRVIDPEMGTGAMKVTPAYSRIDFDLCARNGIEDFVECFDEGGSVTTDGFRGDTKPEAVRKIIDRLENLGLYRGALRKKRIVPLCSRTGSLVDQRFKAQWFLSCGDLGQRTLEEIECGRLKFFPPYHARILQEWISKIQDWCISRQLWWGHRIPAYVSPDGKWIVTNDPSSVPEGARQDPDVLDTWFSSALYPMVAFGWPEVPKPPPLDLMETGHDILYFWVFRMILMSLELCDQLPFDKVLLHGLLRDARGRKMSKSLGNAIDPMHIIEGASPDVLQEVTDQLLSSGYLTSRQAIERTKSTKKLFPRGIMQCGSDALRFTLLKTDTTAQDIPFDVQKTTISKKFCNKVWQGVRFYTGAVEAHGCRLTDLASCGASLDDFDRWILSKFSGTERTVREAFESYTDLHHGAHILEKFWISNFCDVYLEFVKPDVRGATEDLPRRLAVLSEVITSFIIAASPFLPHLCEEIFHKLQLQRGVRRELCTSVHDSSWPSMNHWSNREVEKRLDIVIEKTSEIRVLIRTQGVDEALKCLENFNAYDKKVISVLSRLDSSKRAAAGSSTT